MPDALDQLIRDLSRLEARGRVGALDEENATKLHHNEFSITHPRPTLSATTDRAEGDMHAAIKRRVLGVIDSARTIDGKTILGEVGDMLAEQVKESIGNNTPPNPLAPSTLAARRRRGNESTRTLVDTGDMQASITVETKPTSKGWAD